MGTRANSVEDLIHVLILPCEDRYFQVKKSLLIRDRIAMLLALVQNLGMFAWSPYKVPSVDTALLSIS